MTTPPTILCLASYEKGIDFMRECKRQGACVLLLTLQSLEKIAWPHESIDEIFYMPDLSHLPAVINGVSYLTRTRRIDRIVPLDEYDVLVASTLREHLRLPGLNESTSRFLRDKLAMRMRAQEQGVAVPAFVSATNNAAILEFTAQVAPPWLLKPRAEASTIGIARLETVEEIWPKLEALGDQRSFQLIERYIPGQVYHVDSLTYGGKVVFASASRYGQPPLDVFHGGGAARTWMLRRGSPDEKALQKLNRQVIAALGHTDGATHMEFIKGRDDDRFYFLEVAARVGGAYIADVLDLATGLNLWAEWAKIELANISKERPYTLPAVRDAYGGVIITLAKQENPDTSAYQDPEIVWRMQKPNHVGFILTSSDPDRVATLLDQYAERFAADFTATLPPWTGRPPSDS